jgi:hypothetical protein
MNDVVQRFTAGPVTRHPGQGLQFVVGFNKLQGASRDPEQFGIIIKDETAFFLDPGSHLAPWRDSSGMTVFCWLLERLFSSAR